MNSVFSVHPDKAADRYRGRMLVLSLLLLGYWEKTSGMNDRLLVLWLLLLASVLLLLVLLQDP